MVSGSDFLVLDYVMLEKRIVPGAIYPEEIMEIEFEDDLTPQ